MTAVDPAVLARELGVRVEREMPLARLTTLGVGGPASWVFFPEDPRQACQLHHELERNEVPLRLLGGGSNVVAPDEGLRCAVIVTAALTGTPERLSATRLRCPAGAPIPGLARWAQREGLAGLEFAEGIPAQLGGAIRMNAGANRSSFSALTSAVLLAGPDGEPAVHEVREGDFAYRESFVGREKRFVVGAELELGEDDPEQIKQRMLAYRRRRRASQPVTERSAGCAFKNFAGQSVGALIESLGLKGTRRGGAEISTVHGNFIVNKGGARAADVVALLDLMRERLERETGETPELEVEIWEADR